ncbi:hypothetical protein COBT_003282 [Conglomerata obtusa]
MNPNINIMEIAGQAASDNKSNKERVDACKNYQEVAERSQKRSDQGYEEDLTKMLQVLELRMEIEAFKEDAQRIIFSLKYLGMLL